MLCCRAFYLKIFLREFGHFFNKYFCGYVSKFSYLDFDDGLFRVGVNSLEVLSVLKLHLGFQCRQLVDICVKDLGVGGRWRFVVTYLLLSHKFNFRVLVRTKLQDNFVLRSATALYRGAGWMEREVWEMFGIFFINSVGLRRLLTDYGYLYNPLKKDFPLVGYTEVGYNEILRRISIVSTGDLQLARGFKFGSWWAV